MRMLEPSVRPEGVAIVRRGAKEDLLEQVTNGIATLLAVFLLPNSAADNNLHLIADSIIGSIGMLEDPAFLEELGQPENGVGGVFQGRQLCAGSREGLGMLPTVEPRREASLRVKVSEHVAERDQMVPALAVLRKVAVEPDEDMSLDGAVAHRGEPLPGQLIREEAFEAEPVAFRHELCRVRHFHGNLFQNAFTKANLSFVFFRLDLIRLGIECPARGLETRMMEPGSGCGFEDRALQGLRIFQASEPTQIDFNRRDVALLNLAAFGGVYGVGDKDLNQELVACLGREYVGLNPAALMTVRLFLEANLVERNRLSLDDGFGEATVLQKERRQHESGMAC